VDIWSGRGVGTMWHGVCYTLDETSDVHLAL
jgi:hypothetical protein